jgi:hypothetical protein
MSGEEQFVDLYRKLLNTPLAPGLYVRSRGETTMSVSDSWNYNPFWTSWALFTANLAFGADTMQNNTLIQANERMWPVLSFFTRYAGVRPELARDAPGAFAVLRDGLDIADVRRWPEAEFGDVQGGNNLNRCLAILASLQNSTQHPPRNDMPSTQGCGCGRKNSNAQLGLNDACYQVQPENYARFFTQLDTDSTSLGVWRVGPQDEIFGRYGRVATPAMSFAVTDGVFGTAPKTVYARVVFFNTGERKWRLAYSSSRGCSSTDYVDGSTNNTNVGHWLEARFVLDSAMLGSGSCGTGSTTGADIIVDDGSTSNAPGAPTVFNLVEVSKVVFDFVLSPWQADF